MPGGGTPVMHSVGSGAGLATPCIHLPGVDNRLVQYVKTRFGVKLQREKRMTHI